MGECIPENTLKMTSAKVVKTSVNVTPNSLSQDYTHPDNHNLCTYDMTTGFKPFTIIITIIIPFCQINISKSNVRYILWRQTTNKHKESKRK